MKNFLFILVLFGLLSGCVTDLPVDEPRIVVTSNVDTSVFLEPPIMIHFTGTLEDVADNDQRFYCVLIEWDFGDGETIGMIPGCLEWTDDTKIQKTYETQYTYAIPGIYHVTLTIGDVTSEPFVVVIDEGKQECFTDVDCVVQGCSGQFCVTQEQAKDFVSTCEWRELYGCYKQTSCGCVEGQCHWLSNDVFDACVKGYS